VTFIIVRQHLTIACCPRRSDTIICRQRMALGLVRLVLTSLLTSSSRSPISLLALLICHLSYTTHYAGTKLSSLLHIESLPEEDEVVKS